MVATYSSATDRAAHRRLRAGGRVGRRRRRRPSRRRARGSTPPPRRSSRRRRRSQPGRGRRFGIGSSLGWRSGGEGTGAVRSRAVGGPPAGPDPTLGTLAAVARPPAPAPIACDRSNREDVGAGHPTRRRRRRAHLGRRREPLRRCVGRRLARAPRRAGGHRGTAGRRADRPGPVLLQRAGPGLARQPTGTRPAAVVAERAPASSDASSASTPPPSRRSTATASPPGRCWRPASTPSSCAPTGASGACPRPTWACPSPRACSPCCTPSSQPARRPGGHPHRPALRRARPPPRSGLVHEALPEDEVLPRALAWPASWRRKSRAVTAVHKRQLYGSAMQILEDAS